MAEVWRPVVGYEGHYEVSNLGNVRNSRTGYVLKPIDKGIGYMSVGLSKHGKVEQYYIHRLVATAFVENPNNYNVVNHLDESRDNNRADNLEWTTNLANLRYGTADARIAEKLRGRIGKDSARHRDIVCVETGKVYHGANEAGREHKINPKNINNCCAGRRKIAGGFHWMYREEYENNESLRNKP